MALSPGESITADLIPENLCTTLGFPPSDLENHLQGTTTSQATRQREERTLCSLQELEREHVLRVLDATGWHKGRSCEILGVSRPRLRRLIAQYNLEPNEP